MLCRKVQVDIKAVQMWTKGMQMCTVGVYCRGVQMCIAGQVQMGTAVRGPTLLN